jgi:transcriptional regulator GlxA family with amidase domain
MNLQIRSEDAVIAECQRWIAECYQHENPVQRMAERAGLHPRTFARRFRAATGRSAIDYVVELRVEEAKQILETSDMPVEDVAWEVGYQDPAAFRRMFRKLSGTSPNDYRKRYSRIGMVPAKN